MRRPATTSWPREDTDHKDALHSQGGSDAPEPAPDPVTPPVVEAVEDTQHETQLPLLQTVPKRKDRGGIVTLIIIAILGMILGFAAVLLM